MQENLTALVESAGIVGAGGAGFPTHVKLNTKADTVIINGAECEPLLRPGRPGGFWQLWIKLLHI